jgi:hypothetical protein
MWCLPSSGPKMSQVTSTKQETSQPIPTECSSQIISLWTQNNRYRENDKIKHVTPFSFLYIYFNQRTCKSAWGDGAPFYGTCCGNQSFPLCAQRRREVWSKLTVHSQYNYACHCHKRNIICLSLKQFRASWSILIKVGSTVMTVTSLIFAKQLHTLANITSNKN